MSLKIWFMFCLPFVFGFDETTEKFSLDYFEYRRVKFTCLLGCENEYRSQKFAKEASKKLIATAKVDADKSLINFDHISKCLSQDLSSVSVLIDSQCPNFYEIIQFASERKLFDSMHKWLMINDGFYISKDTNSTTSVKNETEIDSTLIDVVGNLNISVNSDIVIGLRNGLKSYVLYEANNFGKEQGGHLYVENIGYWSHGRGLNFKIDLNGYKYYRRWNFKKWQMRMIAVVKNPPSNFNPELIVGRTLAPGVAVITQTAATIMHVIAEIHNFGYNYTFADRWIGDFTTKTSKVVGNSLHFKTHDISPVLRLMPSFYQYYDVVNPSLTSIETRYYYRIPTKGPGKFENQFLRPLSTGTWICVLVVIFLCAIVLLLSASFEHRPMPGQYAVFSVLASFCQQFFEDNGDQDMRRISGARKITILVTGLSCVLIYNYYTSSVVSWLLIGPPPSINSLQELLDSPLDLIYEDIGYTRSWLQTPSYYYNKRNAKVEDEIRQKKVFNKKKDDLLFLPVDEGIEKVKAGGYAYHTEVNTANMLISRKFTQPELCELGSLQSMEKTMLFAGVQKNSPYKEFLVWSLCRLTERGVVSCIQQRTRSGSVTCEGSSPRALALGGAAPAFILLALGYLLAIVIVVFERLFYKCFTTQQAKSKIQSA